MKYYCLGHGFRLVKLGYASERREKTWAGFYDAVVKDLTVPVYGELPVTHKKLRTEYDKTEDLIFCKTLEDAQALRLAKINLSCNITPEFNQGAIAQGLPLGDFGIHEVDVENGISDDSFQLLGEKCQNIMRKMDAIEGNEEDSYRARQAYVEELKTLLGQHRYFSVSREISSDISDIAICVMKKSDDMHLVASHYFPLNGKAPLRFEEDDKPANRTGLRT